MFASFFRNKKSARQQQLQNLMTAKESASNALAIAMAEQQTAQAHVAELFSNMATESEIQQGEASLAAIQKNVAALKGRVENLEQAIVHCQQAEEQLEEAARRKKESADVRQRADSIEARAVAFDKATALAADAFNALMRTVEQSGMRVGQETNPERLARQVLGDHVEVIMPGFMIAARSRYHFAEDHGSLGEVRTSLTNAMRVYSEQLLNGDTPTEKPKSLAPELPDFPGLAGSKRAFFTKPVFYLDEHGVTRHQKCGVADVPVPVADTAVADGYAVDLTTPSGRARLEKLRIQIRGTWDAEPVELKVDLRSYIEAQRKRAGDEWLAKRWA
jgi:hypothetical protein